MTELPAGTYTDKTQSDYMVFMKNFIMSNLMMYDIMEKDETVVFKLMKALQPVISIMEKMSEVEKLKNKEATVDFVNQNASKMQKMSQDLYKFMVGEAKAAGVPVVKEVPKPKDKN